MDQLPPEVVKYIETDGPVPHELFVLVCNGFVETYNKLQKHHQGRPKKYHTPEEAHQMKCREFITERKRE